MAQQFPTSAKVIYDTLVADASFMSQLGTYTFKGGGPLPAISVVSPGESLPELRNVEGLECIIQDAGDITRTDYLSSDSNFRIIYKVFLVCWEAATGQEMTTASVRVLQLFSGAEATETVAASDGLGAQVQTQIRIPSDRPILT